MNVVGDSTVVKFKKASQAATTERGCRCRRTTIHRTLWVKDYPVSARLGTIVEKDTTTKSTPERSWNSVAQGPRRHVKGHDRLMASLHARAHIRTGVVG